MLNRTGPFCRAGIAANVGLYRHHREHNQHRCDEVPDTNTVHQITFLYRLYLPRPPRRTEPTGIRIPTMQRASIVFSKPFPVRIVEATSPGTRRLSPET